MNEDLMERVIFTAAAVVLVAAATASVLGVLWLLGFLLHTAWLALT